MLTTSTILIRSKRCVGFFTALLLSMVIAAPESYRGEGTRSRTFGTNQSSCQSAGAEHTHAFGNRGVGVACYGRADRGSRATDHPCRSSLRTRCQGRLDSWRGNYGCRRESRDRKNLSGSRRDDPGRSGQFGHVEPQGSAGRTDRQSHAGQRAKINGTDSPFDVNGQWVGRMMKEHHIYFRLNSNGFHPGDPR